MSQQLLDDLVKAFDDINVGHVSKDLDAKGVIDLCSGGVRQLGGPVPVLYAEPKEAMNSFYDLLSEMALKFDHYRWIERPFFNKYHMTLSDTRNLHRIVEDRYAVDSRIVFG